MLTQTKEHQVKIKMFLGQYGEYLLKVNLILSLLFLRCADHKIIIMPLLPTVILFIDTDITARNNLDKYCNTEIIFSLEDLLFFLFCILHCSVYIIVVYKLKYQARKNFSFQNIIKNQPSLCCNF